MTIGTKKIPKTAEMPLITHSLSQPVYIFMYVQQGIKITERVGGRSSLVQSYTIIIEILCNIYIIIYLSHSQASWHTKHLPSKLILRLFLWCEIIVLPCVPFTLLSFVHQECLRLRNVVADQSFLGEEKRRESLINPVRTGVGGIESTPFP